MNPGLLSEVQWYYILICPDFEEMGCPIPECVTVIPPFPLKSTGMCSLALVGFRTAFRHPYSVEEKKNSSEMHTLRLLCAHDDVQYRLELTCHPGVGFHDCLL